MTKERFYDSWEKSHWHRLRKWAEKKNTGEFVIVFDSGLPVRIKAKIEMQQKDEYTEIQIKHNEIDLTQELEG